MGTTLLLITLVICLLLWKVVWAILKPIFEFVYEGIVNCLTTTGMSKQAAKAIISLMGIVFILMILF